MVGSPESFVGWIKHNVVALEQPTGRGVVNLSTSGVHTPTIDTWFERVCRERLPNLLERMAPNNEFGLPALKEAIRRTYRVPSDREIYLTAGASAAYRLVCESLFAGIAGREVLIESPTYQPLAILPPRYGAKMTHVPIPLKRAAGDIASAFSRAVRPTTDALVVSNLHNPTGSLLSRDELGQLARAATGVSPKITLIVDETFLGLGPEPFRTAADLDPCIITVSSLTKTFGLGQLRCGWVIADKERYPQLLADWVQFESIGSKILEGLSLMAFEQLDELLRSSLEHLAKNRILMAEGTEELRLGGLLQGDIPAAGCLYFPRWTGRGALDVATSRLHEEFGVLVSPGRFFCGNCADHFRIGFGGSPQDLREGLERLTRGLRAMT
ncbi:MAG TPA: pyridoxal phosphate-dependent aminotransferase [Planctomycetaceae bacterium]|nr:pyridoxal phosphate-dependent aminotransferase [Planctomycetaceae bacterium]